MTVKGGEVYLSCNDGPISILYKLSNSVIQLLSLYRSPKYSDSLVRKGFDVAWLGYFLHFDDGIYGRNKKLIYDLAKSELANHSSYNTKRFVKGSNTLGFSKQFDGNWVKISSAKLLYYM